VNDAIRRALESDRLIDITTTGRQSGQPRRLEIGLFYLDGQFYLSGSPGRRSWLANLVANPRFTVHLKQSLKADLPAVATPIFERAARREVFGRMAASRRAGPPMDIEARVAGSPLVRVDLRLEEPQ
jgi:deazaflavin-dependent oxidoreductase (nitroreductase family)